MNAGEKRGQLFSFDFLIAAAVLTAALGFSVQFAQLAQGNAHALGSATNANADAIAVLAAQGRAGDVALPASAYCLAIHNATGNVTPSCDSFNTTACEHVFTARRLFACNATVCVAEARVCA